MPNMKNAKKKILVDAKKKENNYISFTFLVNLDLLRAQ